MQRLQPKRFGLVLGERKRHPCIQFLPPSILLSGMQGVEVYPIIGQILTNIHSSRQFRVASSSNLHAFATQGECINPSQKISQPACCAATGLHPAPAPDFQELDCVPGQSEPTGAHG